MALLAMPLAAFAALNQPWQKISDPTAAEVAAVFPAPPPEYSAQFTWGFGGPVTRETIMKDLDGMKALGVNAAIIEPGAGMTHPYLSPEYFELVRVAVEEAKKRDMRLWIMDDGDYPSGLAGGKFTMERPDLRMQGLAMPERMNVAGGEHFSRALGSNIICAVAINHATHAAQALDITSGKVDWTAPAGDWEVALVRSQFRSGPTKSANNPKGVKDYTHSLMDYLDPAAAQLFKEWMFDSYTNVIGAELGRTVLGFRGDEPAFGFNPWTPKLLEAFQRRKGYDLRPYLPFFGEGPSWRNSMMTDEQRRAYADYSDVWSDLFRESYFDMEGEWCADHGVEMQLHIEHEEILPQLAIADGDYFKCFRNIEVPGIDIIWHQIWMDNPADFPKLASSAAHLYGHPRAMCEAFAAYQPPPNLNQARWLLDFLMVHGINRVEYMAYPSSARRGGFRQSGGGGTNSFGMAGTNLPAGSGTNMANGGGLNGTNAFMRNRYFRDPDFPKVATYVNRTMYLMGEGRPAAQIGLYIPSSSFWLADAAESREINTNLLTIAHELLAHQRDFDFVDEQALSSVLKLKDGALVNLSGQGYHAIVVPPALAISHAALHTLRSFAAAGGKVIFMGDAPRLVVGKTFLNASGPADIAWATFHESSAALTDAAIAQLPQPDFAADKTLPLVSYNHRRLRDADVYFVFNSGDDKAAFRAAMAGEGKVQIWDADNGNITTVAAADKAGDRSVSVPLELEPWHTAIVVVGGKATTN